MHCVLPVRALVVLVNAGVSALCMTKRGAQRGVKNNSLDDSAAHYPDTRAGVGRIRTGNNGAWNDAMSLLIMPWPAHGDLPALPQNRRRDDMHNTVSMMD